ncbi:hypothetical protein [Methylocystis heyeri]|uniref:Uncharacterized protein n=1 Tax=Methylocystis heyeri TaxID=391905 RepID=A0A6B8KEW5_9HYPH|nr:hypothetical protein [Methylocystis heyeri]QGM45118.1 hypothetical protein H2LOC_005115 [Methylocystis heyeri]
MAETRSGEFSEPPWRSAHDRAQRMKSFSYRIAPPVLALLYPFALEAFHASVELTKSDPASGTLLAVASIGIAFAIPLIAFVSFMRFAAINDGSGVKIAAALAVASPAIFTFVGVVLYMLHYPVQEKAAWVAAWGVIALVAVAPSHERDRGVLLATKLRSVHGALAASAFLAFLGFHIFNHLTGLAGGDAHKAVMNIGRHWYRAAIVEPVLVLILLSVAATGAVLLWRRLRNPMDGFLALQAASGAYLLFFLIGHMNSVFIYARRWLGIDTEWSFATGAPTGLVDDEWNIRLAPHYVLGVFFLLTHLVGGLRIVMIEHGAARRNCDRMAIVGAGFAALIAAAILMGMCGVRIFSNA